LQTNFTWMFLFQCIYLKIEVNWCREIRDFWAKIYILCDATPAACLKWLKVGFRKVQRVTIILVPKRNQNISSRLNDSTLKIVEKVAPKAPTLRDQWPMAKEPLDHVLSGNFMTVITENNQILVYLQCLFIIEKKNDILHFCNKNMKCSGKASFLHNTYFTQQRAPLLLYF